MNDCPSIEMKDFLPDFVHGRLGTAELARVENHVASCEECAAELDLLRTVAASAPAAPEMDVNRIASALPAPRRPGLVLHQGGGQVAAETRSRDRRTVWSHPSLRIAAAAAVVVAGGLSLLVGRDVLNPETMVGQRSPRVAVATEPPAPVVDRGPAEAVSPPVRSPARPHIAAGTRAALSLVGEMQELSDEHLAALIAEMDEMNAILATEPETISPTIGTVDTSGEIL